jgi:hypothetical protein
VRLAEVPVDPLFNVYTVYKGPEAVKKKYGPAEHQNRGGEKMKKAS